MSAKIDITNKRFTKLVALAPMPKENNPVGSTATHWLCRCDCGQTCVRIGSQLRRGISKWCERCDSVQRGRELLRRHKHPGVSRSIIESDFDQI